MSADKELESLREQVRTVTAQILQDVQTRMELSRKIGQIKSVKGIEIKDERVEREIRNMVLNEALRVGMDTEFALRLLNILLDESETVQGLGRAQNEKQTHLGIFMKARELEARGRQMIHLEVGEPDYPPPQGVGAALADSFRQRRYHYTETRGIAKLREAIGSKEGVKPDLVMVTPGGRFAVFSAIVSLLKPGNELIVIEPGWPAYKECADFVGAKSRVLDTRIEDGWAPDVSELRRMVGPATKMIAINYPNNPTGKILDNKTLQSIVDIARENELFLLSDEVYSDYAFGTPFHSALEFGYDKTVMISSFSKRYAMTGFRVGYAVANQEILKKMSKVQAAGITSVAEPMQYAALAATIEPFAKNVEIMKERLDFVCSMLDRMPVRFTRPDGAMYVFPQLPRGSDMSLIEELLNRGVAVAPGSGFGDAYGKFIRISACLPMDLLEKGLAKIETGIGELS